MENQITWKNDTSKDILALVGSELGNAEMLFNLGATADQKGAFADALGAVKVVLGDAVDLVASAAVIDTANPTAV